MLLLLSWLQRRNLKYHGWLLMGAVYKVTYLLVHAISLHNLDVWFNQHWLGLHYCTAFEWDGLLVIVEGLVIGDVRVFQS